MLLPCGPPLSLRFGPTRKKVWAPRRKTICQRHESKMLKVIKMSKTVPIRCPQSVDIKSHHHWVPLTSLVPGSLFPAIHPVHSQADQKQPSYRTLRNLWPLLSCPFFEGICVPMLIVWDGLSCYTEELQCTHSCVSCGFPFRYMWLLFGLKNLLCFSYYFSVFIFIQKKK